MNQSDENTGQKIVQVSHQEMLDQLRQPDLGIVDSLGTDGAVVITRQASVGRGEGLPSVGNVLGRTAAETGLGALAAEQLGIKAPTIPSERFADSNTAAALHALDLDPYHVIMVAATGRDVQFADKLSPDNITVNDNGWLETKGNDAFFFRPEADTVMVPGEDTPRQLQAEFMRLADCAFIGVQMEDSEGNVVLGSIHSSLVNQHAPGYSPYHDPETGESVPFLEHVVRTAAEHYGADPGTIRLSLHSSIASQNFVYSFPNEAAMRQKFPGWQEAGYVYNMSNRNWQPGDPFNPNDRWEVNARAMNMRDLYTTMVRLGIPQEQFTLGRVLDPAASGGEYASNTISAREKKPSSRDLYGVVSTMTGH